MYTLTLTDAEMAFFRELFQSQLAVTLEKVEVIAALKQKILTTTPQTTPS